MGCFGVAMELSCLHEFGSHAIDRGSEKGSYVVLAHFHRHRNGLQINNLTSS